MEAPGQVASRSLPAWLSKGFWSVADQGLFSIANFAANILLANWLVSKAAYGAFSVAFSYFLLLGIFHTAFLTEPALVFGSARYRKRLPQYLGSLLYGHGLVTLTGAALMLGVGLAEKWYSNEPQTGVAMIAFAWAAPFMLLLWLMRRTCYIESHPQRAAAGDAVYLVSMLAALLVLQHTKLLTVTSAIAVMGGCSLLASAFLLLRERPIAPPINDPLLKDIRADHWKYGRWAAVTGLATFVPSQVYFPMLEKMHGLESAGTLRAFTNLVMPLLQANVALCMLLLPMMVRARGTARFNRIVRNALLLLAGAPVIVWLLLGLFAQPVLDLIYRGRFTGDSSLIWLIALQPVFVGAFSVFHAALQSHHHPKYVFYASLAAAAASLTLGLALTHRYGVNGAAAGMLIGFAVNAALAGYFCRRFTFNGQPPAPQATADDDVSTVEPEVA